jgi:hypothetical protein
MTNPCPLCGGTHYGSTECPFRCDRCKVKTDQCFEEGCPRNARFAAENAAANAPIREHITDIRQLAEEMALTAEGVPGMNLTLSKARIASVCRALIAALDSARTEVERMIPLDAARRLRCEHCAFGYPFTEKSQTNATFAYHQLGEYQLECKAADLSKLVSPQG